MNETPPKTLIPVLAIDDEPGQREMLVFGLSEYGYAVTTAANGEEAIRLAEKGTYELAICDMKMPDLNGVEVLKSIKRLHPEIEIVMVTGYATLENAVESYEGEAYDYLCKPYVLEELLKILQRALERRRRRSGEAA